MAETPGKVELTPTIGLPRLVRCPMCGLVLPEITDTVVYRCGGCCAVLQAKSKSVVSDTHSDKSENEVKSFNSSSSRKGEYNIDSPLRAEKWVVEDDLELDKNDHELGTLETAQIFKVLKTERESRAIRSGISVETYDLEKDEIDRFQNTQNTDAENLTNSEGPSNYDPGSEYDEFDRAELLRLVHQLQDQLSQSHQMVDRSKEQVPAVRRVGYQDPYSGPENRLRDGSNMVPMIYSMHDIMSISQDSNYNDTSSHTLSQGFGVSYGSNMVRRRASQRAPELFEQGPSHPYYSGENINKGSSDMDLHVNCVQSIDAPPIAHSMPTEEFSDLPRPPVFYRRGKPNEFAPQGYNPRFSTNPSINFSNSRWSSDINSEYGGFVHPRPVSGGAPFVNCRNCFALLQLPKEIFSNVKTRKKMRCGACSKLIFVSVVGKKLVLSVHSQSQTVPKEVDNRLNAVVNEGSLHTQGKKKWTSTELSSHDYYSWAYAIQSMDSTVFSSPTYPSFGSDKSSGMKSHHSTSSSNSTNEEETKDFEMEKAVNPTSPTSNSPIKNHFDNSNKFKSLLKTASSQNHSKALKSHHSTSSCTSGDEEEPEVAEVGTTANPTPSTCNLPLEDHFDNSIKYSHEAAGNISGRPEVNEVTSPQKTSPRQNYMKDVTEIEMPSSVYSNNTGTFQESGVVIREAQIRSSGGGDSFFAGIIKKSFRDFMRSSQRVEEWHVNVTVNGHPIPKQLVKKAEKLAGKIQPGNYWYDSRAGFWGVIGGPCCGIIPPFIKEFNYPMPENCACGNTGVFVNGRELHYKDLKLLGSRGLPTDTNGSYIIGISGRVLDVESGEELDSLGKLAPTLEKAKHGFGMNRPVPEQVRDAQPNRAPKCKGPNFFLSYVFYLIGPS